MNNLFQYSSSTFIFLEEWRAIIRRANHYFFSGQERESCNAYLQAIQKATQCMEELLANSKPESHKDADMCFAAYVVSHHNLADVFIQAKQMDSAVEKLCQVHERIYELLYHPTKSYQHIAQHHFAITYRELQHFIQKHGANKRVENCFLLTRYVCETCMKHQICTQ